jgi:hypothetical protein
MWRITNDLRPIEIVSAGIGPIVYSRFQLFFEFFANHAA